MGVAIDRIEDIHTKKKLNDFFGTFFCIHFQNVLFTNFLNVSKMDTKEEKVAQNKRKSKKKPTPSAKRAKTVKSSKKSIKQLDPTKLFRDFTVDVTGLVAGEMVVGIVNSTKDASLRLKSGVIPPRTESLDMLRADPPIWQNFLQKLASRRVKNCASRNFFNRDC